MSKKGLLFGIGVMVLSSLSGCSKPEPVKIEPSLEQIQSICNLATEECYYNNVAKSDKTKGTGITHIGEKDRKFWIEYTGIAKLGVEMSEVKMEVSGDKIKMTLPKAKVLDLTIDHETLNEDSFIVSEDGWFNKNKITAEEQKQAIQNAQAEMQKTVEENSALLLTARNRAKTLIENYLNQLGEAAGVAYQITWVEK